MNTGSVCIPREKKKILTVNSVVFVQPYLTHAYVSLALFRLLFHLYPISSIGYCKVFALGDFSSYLRSHLVFYINAILTACRALSFPVFKCGGH